MIDSGGCYLTAPASKRDKFFICSMNLNMTNNNISSSSATFHCRYAPHISWEVSGGSAFDLIIGLVTVMASLPTIILNGSVILAIKQRKELQKSSNILLSSLAVTDLLVGVIVMPTSAIIDFFTLRQVSFEYTCMLYSVNLFFLPLLFTATLHHLTLVAWERYVAVQNWMNYKLIITNGRLKKIAIATWLSALFPSVAHFTTIVVAVDRKILNGVLTGWIIVETVCLLLVAFFYRKVYLGIRNRKLNDISQIDVLIKAKLESKVAKTTGLLTAAIISSFVPIFVTGILGNVMPVFRTNAAMRFSQRVMQFISLFNPLLYCYRDHRFRNAIRELLGMKKPQAIQSAAGAAEFVRGKDPFRSSELNKVGKRTQRLRRSVTCNLTDATDSDHGTPSVAMLRKSLSAHTLHTYSSSSHHLHRSDPQEPSVVVETSAAIHAKCKVKRRNTILKVTEMKPSLK